MEKNPCGCSFVHLLPKKLLEKKKKKNHTGGNEKNHKTIQFFFYHRFQWNQPSYPPPVFILHISTIKFIFFFSFFSVCEKCIEKKVSLHPVYYSNFKQGSKELIPKEFYFIFLYHQQKIFFEENALLGAGGTVLYIKLHNLFIWRFSYSRIFFF